MDADRQGQGSYLRRAEALIAARRDLFGSAPRPSTSAAAFVAPARDLGHDLTQPAVRQLRLPLPHERGRRRARMLR